ncbi:scyllo-inositol 2-dehydrogenase (NADP+) [Azospirillum lipoferum]|uniref:Oxidoreductase n=1 Tax=Azospirillum lipoferum TaxID=193 RepID=A0A5A9GGE1_AZOLI|nr:MULTISPECIES: oxidoreductase [Azospirillum]KAA0592359.1 oxidoreductase [Azospirillum lipoferum]MCP1614611.1 scyllo-inositol 2-dehydrogenase (NADP+) [Azospirillum lipoferum]MDW5532558.1 oxidoreductase [Azospirillum sp. NL1]
MKSLSVGLLGFGLAGSVFHAPLIRSEPRLRLTAVASSRIDDIRRSVPGAEATTAEAVIADPAIDLVVIATPNTSHAPLARAALLAGKHVVIDKPVATSAAEADELIELAKRQGRLLSVFHNRRWDNDFLTLRACLEAGEIGRPYHYEAHYDRFRPQIKQGWREQTLAGSGVLFDLGAHLIDQALTLFGMPDRVLADVGAQRPDAQVDDWFHIVLGYGPMRAILHCGTVVCRPGPRFQLHGDGGSFLKYGMDGQEAALRAGGLPTEAGWGVDEPENHALLVKADGTERRVETIPGDYPAFYRGVAAAILDGAPLPVTAEQARDVLSVLEAVRKAAGLPA